METHQQTRSPPVSRLSKLIVGLLVAPIQAYQFLISPWLGKNCRFYPSCSCYTQEALQEHGPLLGIWLSVRRISKCHPWHPGGVDLVPLPSDKK